MGEVSHIVGSGGKMMPLVLRPAYGESGVPSAGPGGAQLLQDSGLPESVPTGKGPVAEAKLPGDTERKVDRGLSLDKDIPGTSTFNKDENDIREEKHEDEPIQEVEEADDLAKDRGRIDTKEDNAHDQNIGVPGQLGPRDPDDTSITKFPYRDDHRSPHYAGIAQQVVELWNLRSAHDLPVALGDTVRVASSLDEVFEGTNPKVKERSRTCSVGLKRVNAKNLRWLFSVDCGNGPKVVRLRAERPRSGVVKLSKMSVEVACSCPAWRWLGSEHHSQRESYLDGAPRGTASVPVIRDPKMHNRVCKHVAAVIGFVHKWEVPKVKA